MPVPFNVYADFMSVFGKVLTAIKVFTQKNIKITFVAVFLTIFFCVDNNFRKPIIVYRDENAAY